MCLAPRSTVSTAQRSQLAIFWDLGMEVFGGIILPGNSFYVVIMVSFQEGMPVIPTRHGRILVLIGLVKTLAGGL